MTAWAVLRQVVLATGTINDDVAVVRQAFGFGAGFADPELRKLNLADATMPVSSTRYLEFVAPIEATGPVHAWLAKTGPRGGFTLSVQHPDPDGVRARCAEAGVRVPIDDVAFGRTVLQLHPRDVGLLLEVDGIPEPDVWFWDDVDPGPEPGAGVDEIVGVDITVDDPESMTALWARILDVEPSDSTAFDLGGSTVRFVAGAPSADWNIQLRSSGGSDLPDLPGITFTLV
ncbi:VOC family protein [Rudaeicoccus suwonensis]|uniref:Glyoxalase-like protein n=1 Tax=Rudaeicoccus suwonensis TaxID=657409 RepID=A0A561DX29_9MICO|nr:VOC family protein [Rudaeicoccus suwonensis]TWE07890.1 glyoxalase-like protein [Rudaeicoccus suwonensis]